MVLSLTTSLSFSSSLSPPLSLSLYSFLHLSLCSLTPSPITPLCFFPLSPPLLSPPILSVPSCPSSFPLSPLLSPHPPVTSHCPSHISPSVSFCVSSPSCLLPLLSLPCLLPCLIPSYPSRLRSLSLPSPFPVPPCLLLSPFLPVFSLSPP